MYYIDNNKLCLTYDELVPIVLKRDNYHYHRKQGNIVVLGRGGNGSKILIEYESAIEEIKTRIKQVYGNPYDYMAKQPILDLIDWDYQAQTYYMSYVLPNGSKLPASDIDAMGKSQINYVERYTKCVSWLNMLGKFTTDKRALKQALNISVMDFWDVVSELIKKQDIALPSNPKRLKEKLKEYNSYVDATDRYEMIIEKYRFGNSNAEARDEESDALILKMLSDPRNHDDTVIAAAYNQYALANGKKPLTAGAIGYIRRQNEHILAVTRDDAKKVYSKYGKQLSRKRASAPLLFINADDNDLDLYFTVKTKDTDGKTKTNHYYRPKLYVIIDTYNDYILGYAYGDTVTKELIYEAFRNATNHIQELTGDYYLAHQVQVDRWGLDVKLEGELATFLKRAGGKLTPQANGAPQGKYIERSFGTEWHQVLKVLPTGNYAGHNITALERVDSNYIAKNAKNHPSVEDMPRIIEGFINVMRMKPNPKTGLSRQVEWLEAFRTSAKSQKNKIDTATKLSIMGIKRAGSPLSITTRGIEFALNKAKYRFDLDNETIWKHNGAKVDVYYDAERMDEVLISNGKDISLVARNYEYFPAALADRVEGDGKRLADAFNSKKAISAKLTTELQDKLKVLDGKDIDAESLLQAGVMLKDLKHSADAEYLKQLYGVKKELKPAVTVVATKEDREEDDQDVRDLY